MKKITIGLVLLMISGASHGATMTSATFTIYDDIGQIVPFDTSPVAPVTGSIGAGRVVHILHTDFFGFAIDGP